MSFPAKKFIGAVEKYGLSRDMDRAIIDQTLQTLVTRAQQSAPIRKVFINLSAQEIQGRGILGFAETACKQLSVAPEHIVFEILERDAIGDMTSMRKFLESLRKKGFAFAIDDFGSGYNSFHYLRELHFEYVKIDGDFVRNIINSKVDRVLVQSLANMCQGLGILTIAEFVENNDILTVLRQMGIDYVQGNHIALPQSQMRG